MLIADYLVALDNIMTININHTIIRFPINVLCHDYMLPIVNLLLKTTELALATKPTSPTPTSDPFAHLTTTIYNLRSDLLSNAESPQPLPVDSQAIDAKIPLR